ncbi:MAG: SPASM domain-containing protein [Candidatus Aenigmarchaeota archaeon]|nr:SPASM domain-containing protein [Candidatus Aenigmarchaeota archaeon]
MPVKNLSIIGQKLSRSFSVINFNSSWFYTIFIDPKGYVNACSPAGRGLPSLNVREKSLREIWNSKELQQIRKLVSRGSQFEICQKCGLIDLKMHIRNSLIDGVINEV